MIRVLLAILTMFWASMVSAQSGFDPGFQDAADAACAPFGVAGIEADADGTLRVTCNADVTAFVPLLGGLAPALSLGAAAAVAAALADGNATPDTQ